MIADIAAPRAVEIVIRDDRKVVWINDEEGRCLVRICDIRKLEVHGPVVEHPSQWQDYFNSLTDSERTQLEAMSKGMKGYAD